MTRPLSTLLIAGALLLSFGPTHVQAQGARKPNILVIVADDMGYADFGAQGCKDIPTPNIDSIAKNGVRFTNGYVSGPYCSPTRAGIMTGRYQTRYGHEFNPGGGTEKIPSGCLSRKPRWQAGCALWAT